MFNDFCAKFNDFKVNHLHAGIMWYKINAHGTAPTADDVPENNDLRIMDFLKNWENSHA